jgi:hypothetical protein
MKRSANRCRPVMPYGAGGTSSRWRSDVPEPAAVISRGERTAACRAATKVGEMEGFGLATAIGGAAALLARWRMRGLRSLRPGSVGMLCPLPVAVPDRPVGASLTPPSRAAALAARSRRRLRSARRCRSDGTGRPDLVGGGAPSHVPGWSGRGAAVRSGRALGQLVDEKAPGSQAWSGGV